MPEFDFRTVLKTYYTPAQIQRLASVKVGIAGAGGLGSNCAVALARSGIGNLVIVDHDIVEPSNLNRQVYLPEHLGQPKVESLLAILQAIHPQIHVEAVQQWLDPDNAAACFAGCAVVVEALDTPSDKAMLARLFLRSTICYITASGLAGYGDSDRIRTRRLGPSAWLVGDDTSSVSAASPPYAPCVQIAAAKEADLALSWVLKGQVIK